MTPHEIRTKNALRIIALSTSDSLARNIALDDLQETSDQAQKELLATCWGESIHSLRRSAESQYLPEAQLDSDAAVAAIEFALKADEGMTFLRLWSHGEFECIRRDWSDVPDAVFIGADPLFQQGA